MKKRVVSLLSLLALCLLLALPVLADSRRELPLVCDDYGLLTQSQTDELEARAEEYSRQYECDIILVIVPDTQGYGIQRFAEAVYSKYQYGWGEERSGVMLLLSMAGRDYDLLTHGFGSTAFTEYGGDWVMYDVKRYLKRNDWYGAFDKYLEEAADYLQRARNGRPIDYYGFGSPYHRGFRLSVRTVLWSLLAAVIAALIVVAVLRTRMKSAVLQTKADDYLDGELQLEGESDTFQKKDIVRTVRSESKGRSGGGGFSSGGGFSHHSGKF